MSDKIFNSPLWYPGGKKWLAKQLLDLIPPDTTEIVSPFFGGGAFELNAAARGYRVHGYDIDKHLVAFWNEFIKDPDGFIEACKLLLRLHPDKAYWKALKKDLSRRNWGDLTPEAYYIFSRLGFCAKNLADPHYIVDFCYRDGEFYRKNRKTEKPEEYAHCVFPYDDLWQCFPELRLTVDISDFKETLSRHPNAFVYCDPPYSGSEYMYRCEFDHEGLFRILNNRKNWVLSYADMYQVHTMYKHFDRLGVKRHLGMRGGNRNELLILSPDIAERYRELS